MNKVLFRTDGYTQIGLGHLMRCLALAQHLDAGGVEVIFAVRQVSLPFCQSRQDWVGTIVVVPECALHQEIAWLHRQPEFNQADWLVLDGYQFDLAYRNQFTKRVFKLGVFDDTNSSGSLDVDMIINWAPGAEQLNYAQHCPDAALCIGEDYRILRQEFLNLTDKSWSKRSSLMLMFGASDPLNLTLLVLEELDRLAVSMPIVVVTGAAYANLAELNRFLAHAKLNIQHLHDCQHIADVMRHSRLAISAAGGSQFELLHCATPAILVVLADNQRFASLSAAQQGWCQVVESEQCCVPELVQICLDLWQQSAQLEAMHNRAMQQKIPDGGSKIIETMVQLSEAHKGQRDLNS